MKAKKLIKIMKKDCRFCFSVHFGHTDVNGNLISGEEYMYAYHTKKKLDELYGNAKVEVWDLKRGQDNVCNTLKIFVKAPHY